jgi:hypothetical protein
MKALGDLWRLNVSVAVSIHVVQTFSNECMGECEGFEGIERLSLLAGDHRVWGWKHLRPLRRLCVLSSRHIPSL